MDDEKKENEITEDEWNQCKQDKLREEAESRERDEYEKTLELI